MPACIRVNPCSSVVKIFSEKQHSDR